MNPVLKKIARKCILFLSFVPTKWICSLEYFYHTHRLPNVSHPKRFTEWMQWYKLYYRNETMFECVDKYEVRQYVEKHGCGKYLNTLYQLCDDANDIDYVTLPNRFVIKTTDGGNGENVYICKDKKNLDVTSVNKLVNSWKNKELGTTGGEWAYSGCKGSRIIVEKYLEDPDSKDGSIDDYKLICFNGKFRFLWVDKNRFSDHRRGFWNEKLEFLKDVYSDHPTFKFPPNLPTNTREMIQIAEKLSAGFPFARVDFYNIRSQIIFGEITFYPWSGYVQYHPDSFDFELGRYFMKPDNC